MIKFFIGGGGGTGATVNSKKMNFQKFQKTR